MKGNFKKSSERGHADLRHSRNRQWIEDSRANDAKAPRPFGDEHVAIRQECEAPGIGETRRDSADTNALDRRLESLWELRQRR